MRCPYCHTLIIHKFNGNYNRLDRKRKSRHMRHCDERPEEQSGEPEWKGYDRTQDTGSERSEEQP